MQRRRGGRDFASGVADVGAVRELACGPLHPHQHGAGIHQQGFGAGLEGADGRAKCDISVVS